MDRRLKRSSGVECDDEVWRAAGRPSLQRASLRGYVSGGKARTVYTRSAEENPLLQRFERLSRLGVCLRIRWCPRHPGGVECDFEA